MVFISYIKLSVSVNDYLDLLPYLFLIIHNKFHLYFDAYFDEYLGFDVYIKLFFLLLTTLSSIQFLKFSILLPYTALFINLYKDFPSLALFFLLLLSFVC